MASGITSIVNEEALAEGKAGIIRVTLKLNSDLWATGHNAEPLPWSQILANNMGHEVMPIKYGQNVIMTDVQTMEENTDSIQDKYI